MTVVRAVGVVVHCVHMCRVIVCGVIVCGLVVPRVIGSVGLHGGYLRSVRLTWPEVWNPYPGTESRGPRPLSDHRDPLAVRGARGAPSAADPAGGSLSGRSDQGLWPPLPGGTPRQTGVQGLDFSASIFVTV